MNNQAILEKNCFEIKIGRTLYIVNSLYTGKESISDKLKKLITRKLENQDKAN